MQSKDGCRTKLQEAQKRQRSRWKVNPHDAEETQQLEASCVLKPSPQLLSACSPRLPSDRLPSFFLARFCGLAADLELWHPLCPGKPEEPSSPSDCCTRPEGGSQHALRDINQSTARSERVWSALPRTILGWQAHVREDALVRAITRPALAHHPCKFPWASHVDTTPVVRDDKPCNWSAVIC